MTAFLTEPGQSGAGDFILASIVAGVIHLAVARRRRQCSRMAVSVRSLMAGFLAYVVFIGLSRLHDLLPLSLRFSWVVPLLVIVLPVILGTPAANALMTARPTAGS